MKINLMLAGLMTIMLTSETAQASLSVLDDPKWGARSIVYDSTTGLEWLQPIKTAGLSFNQVTLLLGSGNYTNFSYATTDQVITLFGNFGLLSVPSSEGGSNINFGPSADLVSNYTHFFELITETGNNSFYDGHILSAKIGSLAATPSSVYSSNVWLYGISTVYLNGLVGTEIGGNGYSLTQQWDYQNTGNGSWLVRAANVASVPVPAAAWFFGSALAGIGLFGHRKPA